MRKTYQAKGLMEWECLIRSGKTTLHVPFTGGTQTEYGVSPAKYSTESPVIQCIIEGSDYFRKGRITLQSAKPTTAKTAADQSKPLDAKAFSTLADAKAWLAKEHGVAPDAVLTMADAVAAAKARGVALTIGKAKKG